MFCKHTLFSCRARRQDTDYEVKVTFDFVLPDIYQPGATPAEMDDNSYAQFDMLIQHFTGLIHDGVMDIPGLIIQPDSYSTFESFLDCEQGTTVDYGTFTCSEYTLNIVKIDQPNQTIALYAPMACMKLICFPASCLSCW